MSTFRLEKDEMLGLTKFHFLKRKLHVVMVQRSDVYGAVPWRIPTIPRKVWRLQAAFGEQTEITNGSLKAFLSEMLRDSHMSLLQRQLLYVKERHISGGNVALGSSVDIT
ncbi:hypothetical protein MKW98_006320, partial [Papaver atlanticum]